MPKGMRFALFIKLFMSSLFPSRPFRTYVAETWQCCSPISQKAASQTLCIFRVEALNSVTKGIPGLPPGRTEHRTRTWIESRNVDGGCLKEARLQRIQQFAA